LSLRSNVSAGRYRKLASYRRRGGEDTTRTRKPGENAKPRRCAASAVARVNLVNSAANAMYGGGGANLSAPF